MGDIINLSIMSDFHLCERLSVFIIFLLWYLHSFVVHFYECLLYFLFTLLFNHISYGSSYYSKIFSILQPWGFLLHSLSLFLFLRRKFWIFLEVFSWVSRILFVFHIFRYTGPLVGFFASTFLLLSGSFQLILSHIFF